MAEQNNEEKEQPSFKNNNFKLDLSNTRFKKISNSNNKKFQYLPNWLDSVSYRYEEEYNKHFPKGYYHYKRGTIIRADFGVNMGSEFSFTHFAIVLDKNDNSKKRTLTVIPLTSKQKTGRFSLGKEIFNQTLVILNNRIAENNELKSVIFERSKKNRLQLVHYFNDFIDYYIDNYPDYENKLKQFKINNDDTTGSDISAAIEKLKEFVNNEDLLHKNKNLKSIDSSFVDRLVSMAKDLNDLLPDMDRDNQNTKDLQKIIDTYSEYNKNSYARLTDITTISKFRIKRINRFDPSGKIRLNGQQMKELSDRLMDLYISK